MLNPRFRFELLEPRRLFTVMPAAMPAIESWGQVALSQAMKVLGSSMDAGQSDPGQADSNDGAADGCATMDYDVRGSVAMRPESSAISSAATVDGGSVRLEQAFGEDGVPSFQLRRLLADGSVDSNFGANGIVSLPSPNSYTTDQDGRTISSATTWYSQVGVDQNGSIVVMSTQWTWSSAAVSDVNKGDGKSDSGGDLKDYTSNNAVRLMRFDATGAADLSYGEGGVATIDLGNYGYVVDSVMTSDGGFALLTISQGNTGIAATTVRRLDAMGQVDKAFGAGGSVAVTLPQTADTADLKGADGSITGYVYANRLFAGADGSLIVAGQSMTFTVLDSMSASRADDSGPSGVVSSQGFAIKLMGDGSLYAAYGDSGTAVFDLPSGIYGSSTYTLDEMGNLTASFGVGERTVDVARVTASGVADPMFMVDVDELAMLRAFERTPMVCNMTGGPVSGKGTGTSADGAGSNSADVVAVTKWFGAAGGDMFSNSLVGEKAAGKADDLLATSGPIWQGEADGGDLLG